jgi:hypothetical protein
MSDEIQFGRRSVRLTHPERVLFPEDGVTKGDLAKYYAEIGDAIVPHLRHRPFTLQVHAIDRESITPQCSANGLDSNPPVDAERKGGLWRQ